MITNSLLTGWDCLLSGLPTFSRGSRSLSCMPGIRANWCHLNTGPSQAKPAYKRNVALDKVFLPIPEELTQILWFAYFTMPSIFCWISVASRCLFVPFLGVGVTWVPEMTFISRKVSLHHPTNSGRSQLWLDWWPWSETVGNKCCCRSGVLTGGRSPGDVGSRVRPV